ncbi:DUF4197 domain-containing protein [Novosphingobium sp. UBA1939]|jgi:hypothetical protein|uniref:DUF4197 domain-containing protein n=1 Tax=Novosphingobium sp. UBA1939 TaxID=1946982 RepID=UPI0025EBC117|nr:DUF4197 domain-containing protein [Novosphingobium sp. UBA1939]
MAEHDQQRRMVLAGMASMAVAPLFGATAQAQVLGSGLTGILGNASDSALDKLAQPGAFYNDSAVRILLPLVGNAGGLGGALGSVLGAGDRLGLTDGITRKLNDAAGLAAKEAKPIFRAAISRLSLNDVPGIVSQNDGASQYLRRSAGTELTGRMRPLINAALGKVGAFNQLDSLSRRSSLISAAGITRDKLGNSVTDQALNGIFKYIGSEEGRLRANPAGTAGSLLKGILGN